MSEQITTALAKQFSRDVEMLAQQTDSVLSGGVRNEPINAEEGLYDQIGAADGNDIVDRHGDTQYAQTPHARRKVIPIPWEWADLIDRPDKVRMLWDPTNPYVKTAVSAANRRKDDHIISALFSTAYEGKTGSTPVSYPTAATHVVPVDLGGSAEGMTVNKAIRARRLLIDLDNDMKSEEFHIAVGGQQLEDMLKEEKATSSDYVGPIKALITGEIDYFLGFFWHVSTRLLTDANDYRRCAAWCKSGMLLAVAEEIKTNIDVLPQKRHSTQVRVEMDMGATRMQEAKVVEIKCDE
jgi:hypothetical protein